MRRVMVVATAQGKAIDCVAPAGWQTVSIDPSTTVGDLVAAISDACGGWPDRLVAVGDGPIGGRFVTAALAGWLPIDGVAAAAHFDSMPVVSRWSGAAANVVLVSDDDARALADRIEGVHLAEDLPGAVAQMLSRLP